MVGHLIQEPANGILLIASYFLLIPIFPFSWGIDHSPSLAFLSSCIHVSLLCLMSVSRSLHQVFLGHPLFLVPWAFHLRACLVVPECVADPSFSLDLLLHMLLACSLTEIIVADGIWPVDVQDLPQEAIDECLLVLLSLWSWLFSLSLICKVADPANEQKS